MASEDVEVVEVVPRREQEVFEELVQGVL